MLRFAKAQSRLRFLVNFTFYFLSSRLLYLRLSKINRVNPLSPWFVLGDFTHLEERFLFSHAYSFLLPTFSVFGLGYSTASLQPLAT